MTIDLQQYADKKVILVHHQYTEDSVELEGTVKAVAPNGIMIKPKGKTNLEIIDTESIDDIRLAAETASAARASRALKAKTLKPLKLGQARAHLLERHGQTLEYVNGLSEEDAFRAHESLDHVALGLGHVHGDGTLTEAELAIRQAENGEDAEVDPNEHGEQ